MSMVFSAVLIFGTDLWQQSVDPSLADNPIWGLWTKISVVIGFLASLVLIVSGIGLLYMRTWGRNLSIAYSIYAIIGSVVGVVIQWMFVMQPMLDRIGAPEDSAAAGVLVGAVGSIIGTCIGLLYPVILWYFMTRPHVVAAFSGELPTTMEHTWPPAASPFAPRTAVDPNNPYVAPQSATISAAAMAQPLTGGGPPNPLETVVDTCIPSQNGAALLSYYLGIFSFVPCLGFPLGIAALYYGFKGLKNVRQQPAVRGKVHAWVGIICGSLFLLFNVLVFVGVFLGIYAAATSQ